ncbi:NADH-quinone oxidoreductase subunit L [Geothrix fuzhouensis]|uniref:NADH-quinone oxidoreductase subunit L n=1 Tax=Geothrix fuzhouensis TaxID=2966451 RepID=UPI002148BDFA|nr:NADH-quinone oxidoreductase subunit L [Geothrix fuzhouensis]
MNKYYWLIPILPLLGAAFNGLLGKRLGKGVVTVAGVGVVFISLLLATSAFLAMKALPDHRLVLNYGEWMVTGSMAVPFGLVIDPLSGTMMLVVTGIGFLIHLYSVGYMHAEEGYARFFSYMNLFVFFMLTLVLGSSLPLMFVGWEGVGLCSYLLIGYYFETDFAPQAGLKAFLFNRVGDLGVSIGMLVLFASFGTLTISDILIQAGHLAPEASFGILTFATLMLFVGATGKSAQLPLYLWLPDAMAGPTPVSALIHAATMVTSGIYMICRLAPVYTLTPTTLTVVAWVGAATALFAATIGLFQRDIKKVLAYSTVSQLGYMFLGLGAAGFSAGFFHVFTHAWFKALLFLGAGSAITAMHHEQDLFKMGGLKNKTKITFITMVAGTIAIMGFPGTSGFFSKDEILYLAFLKSPALWVVGVIAACCTSFYMWRLMALAFWGEPRDKHAYEHAHESPLSMTVPLMVLAVGSLLWGFWGVPEAFGGHFNIGEWLKPALTYGQTHAAHGHHEGPAVLLAVVSTTLGLAFGLLGWLKYKTGPAWELAFAEKHPFLHDLLVNKYYVDEGVELYLLRPIRWFGNLLWKLFDVIIIDGLGVNLPGALARVFGDFTALFQTGRVRNYALSMALGAAILLYVFLK